MLPNCHLIIGILVKTFSLPVNAEAFLYTSTGNNGKHRGPLRIDALLKVLRDEIAVPLAPRNVIDQGLNRRTTWSRSV